MMSFPSPQLMTRSVAVRAANARRSASEAAKEIPTMPTAPPLFYVSPEWDKLGRLTRHSLVWNALDGPHTKEGSCHQALVNRRPLAGRWTPPVAMLERAE